MPGFTTGAIARGQVLFVVAAVLVSGCGGGSSGHAAKQAQRQAYVQQAVSTSIQQSSQAALTATAKSDRRRRHERGTPPGQHASAATASKKQHSQLQQQPSAQRQAKPQQNAQPRHATRHRQAAGTGPAASHGPASSHHSAQAEFAKFKQSYEPVIGQLTRSSHAIGAALRGAASSTRDQILSTFRGLASRWHGQLGQLESLKPPTNLAAEFNTLASAATRIGSDLGAVVAAVASRDKATGGHAVASLVNDLNAARSADSALQQKLAAG